MEAGKSGHENQSYERNFKQLFQFKNQKANFFSVSSWAGTTLS